LGVGNFIFVAGQESRKQFTARLTSLPPATLVARIGFSLVLSDHEGEPMSVGMRDR
jgi:hypothetical protein